MEIVKMSRRQAHVAILLIFLLGFAAGVLTLNLYQATSMASTEDYTRLERISKRLELSSEQRRQVEQILGDAGAQLQEIRRESQPKIAEVRQQTRERLRAALSKAQWQQFQKSMTGARQHRERLRARGPFEKRN